MKPYRIIVFATGFRAVKRLKTFTRVERRGFAYVEWNPVQHYQEARLPDAGSFLFSGIVETRKVVFDALSRADTDQVAVRTNQDKTVCRYVKHGNRISAYGERVSITECKSFVETVIEKAGAR